MRNQQKQQDWNNVKKFKKMVADASAEAGPQPKDLPSIEVVIPGCNRVDHSEASFSIIAAATSLVVDAVHHGWRTQEESQGLFEELALWLVNVCDPKRECATCKTKVKKVSGASDEQRV